MKAESDRPVGRREFFRGILRGIGFAALAAGGFLLAARRRSASGLHDCVNRGICRNCSLVDDCILPQAMSARQALKKG